MYIKVKISSSTFKITRKRGKLLKQWNDLFKYISCFKLF